MEENKEEVKEEVEEEIKKASVGRPKKFKSAEELQKKIDEYFNSCYMPLLDKEGNIVTNNSGEPIVRQFRPYTMAGLADSLDMNRRTLINYNKDEEFYEVIEKAKRKCEIYAEERLFDKDGVKGAMFSLTNNYKDWANKQEVEGKIGVGSIEEYLKKVESPDEY